MDQYNFMQTDTEEPKPTEGSLNSKKIISKTCFAVFMLAAVVLVVQLAIKKLVDHFSPEIAQTDWYVWALTAVSLVGIGFPIYCLVMRTIPDSPKKDINKVKPSAFIVYFFICAAAMYISSFLTAFITMGISIIKGDELINPAAEAITNGNYIVTLIYVAIVAPIVEEMIFRKFMLNKLRRFGDLPAILVTGLAFGLFHFNFAQFFYAAVLGFLFAYITIRSNTIRYSVLLHMLINFIGIITSFFVKNMTRISLILFVCWLLTALSLGIIFFILNIKKVRFERTQQAVKASAFILNPGSILFIVLSIVLFMFNTFAS